MKAWRRAVESENPFSGLVALWEAVEGYIVDTRVMKSFTREEKERIKLQASEGFSGEKQSRIAEVMSKLNEPSTMYRLDTALKDDRVPLLMLT
ncbi:MAG: hypothetical protein U0075_01630 [Thermomicrobiales bacterium]